MRFAVRVVLLATGILAAWGTVGLAQPASKAEGHWQGKIQIPDHELAITVDLDRGPKGAWIGSMTVTGTSAVDVPLSDVTVEENSVKFAAGLPDRATFEGRLSADSKSLSGTAASAKGQAPFELARSGDANVKTPAPSTPLTKDFEGAWEGSIDAGGKVRQVGLKLSSASDGSATAVLLAEGNQQIPVTTVTIKDKDLLLESRMVSGTYHGTLDASGEIAGEWTQGPVKVALTFKRAKP